MLEGKSKYFNEKGINKPKIDLITCELKDGILKKVKTLAVDSGFSIAYRYIDEANGENGTENVGDRSGDSLVLNTTSEESLKSFTFDLKGKNSYFDSCKIKNSIEKFTLGTAGLPTIGRVLEKARFVTFGGPFFNFLR